MLALFFNLMVNVYTHDGVWEVVYIGAYNNRQYCEHMSRSKDVEGILKELYPNPPQAIFATCDYAVGKEV